MQQEKRDTAIEAAFRRGWQQATVEAENVIEYLLRSGYSIPKAKQPLAIHNNYFITPWRNGNLEQREPYPFFDLQKVLKIAKSKRGYDWILNEPEPEQTALDTRP